MGLSNDTVLSGHLVTEMARRNGFASTPLQRCRQPAGWLKYYRRPASVGQANSPIHYTSTMDQRISPVTPATSAVLKPHKYSYSTATGEGSIAAQVWSVLVYPPHIIDYVYPMLYMESGHWTNKLTTKDRNPGSLMWKPGQGWAKGVYVPANGTFGIHFDTWQAFADQLYKEMSKGPGYPIRATSLADFVHRLKLNNYFGAESEDSYLAKLQRAQAALDIDAQKDAHTFVDQERKRNEPKKGLKWWQWGLIGVGGLVVLKVLRD